MAMLFTQSRPAPVHSNYVYNDDYWAVLDYNARTQALREQKRRVIAYKQRLVEYSYATCVSDDRLFHFDVRKVHNDYFKSQRIRMSSSELFASREQASGSGVVYCDVFSKSRQYTCKSQCSRPCSASDYSIVVPHCSYAAGFYIYITYK